MKCLQCEKSVQEAGYLIHLKSTIICPQCYEILAAEALAWGKATSEARKALKKYAKSMKEAEVAK
jgi:phage FluMu protein Com